MAKANPGIIRPRLTTWSLNKLHVMTGLSRRRLQQMVKERTLTPIPRICRTIAFDPETALTAIIASSPTYSYLIVLLKSIKSQQAC